MHKMFIYFAWFVMAFAPIATIHGEINPKPYRYPVSLDRRGYVIEFDDGSIWRVVDSWSASNVKRWKINDAILIYPGFSNFLNGSRFVLHNETRGDKVYAEIGLGPLKEKQNYNRILQINYTTGVVDVVDGRGVNYHWRIDPSMNHILSSWRVENCVVYGLNSNIGLFEPSFPYLLFNVDSDTFIKAQYN